MDGNFKTTEVLFSRILEDFASFTQAQLIDEGMFYKDVKYVLALLGIMWYRDAEYVIEVNNYKGCLPSDFKLLDAAYSCEATIVDTPQPDGLVMQQLTFDHYPSTQPDWHDMSCNGQCGGACAQPTDLIFNRHVLTLVKRGNFMCQYHTPKLLKLGNVNTKRHCTKGCANVYSVESDTITIQNGHIYTNFKEGNVFIRYHAFPLDEETGLPLIPDDPIIEKCIEMYIKASIIRNLWTNGDADVQQQVRYYDDLADKAMGEAKYLTKLPSFQTMVNAIRLQRKRLNVYQLYPAQPSWPASKRI